MEDTYNVSFLHDFTLHCTYLFLPIVRQHLAKQFHMYRLYPIFRSAAVLVTAYLSVLEILCSDS